MGEDVDGLVSNAEPVCAALNIFRFILLRESGSSKVSRQREVFCNLVEASTDLFRAPKNWRLAVTLWATIAVIFCRSRRYI